MTEDKMAGWHHRLNRHEFEQALGVADGQGCLGCCSTWGHKELDMTERLDNNSKVSSVKNITLCVQHSLAPGNLLAWCAAVHGVTKSQTRLSE